jgi:sigma-54 dependent transcriptional regulator, acetoin dehydrogenase operon transcriptional activator AcoR
MADRDVEKSHVADVLKVAEGRGTEHDPIIAASWRRCMQEHQLDPTYSPDVYIHTDERLTEHRQRAESFLRTARFGLEALYKQVAGLGYVLLLTDQRGVTIDFIGDTKIDDKLRRAGLYLGAEWSEGLAGTNGVGTCIATGKGLIVHQRDHFSSNHIDLSCTAVPIFDGQGGLAAVLDISALCSPREKESQSLALTLVTSYAHRIENAALLKNFNRNWILRLSHSPEFLCVDPEYLLCLDDYGQITAFNNRAALLLQKEIGERDGSPTGLKGRSFEDLFEFSLSDIGSLTGLARPLRLRSGQSLFAHAVPPQVPVRSPAPQKPTELPRPFAALTSGDAKVLAVLERVAKLVDSPLSLLIQGETGTGKEFFAKAIHEASTRSKKDFIAVNCAAFPETLIESELFGYEAGAFTGARAKGKAGLIARANGGTLFLDEIGDMPLTLQTRLLRVLSERELVPVGGTRPMPLDIRVIAATHQDLKSMIKEGRFREDLYYRLNGFEVALPPLRERTDIEWLIERLISLRCPPSIKPPKVSAEALSLLRQYPWPGNIRQLANGIDLAIALCSNGVVTANDLPASVFGATGSVDGSTETYGNDDSTEGEAESLRARLASRRWNVTQVARDLNVDRTTIHRRMKRFGIVAPNNYPG